MLFGELGTATDCLLENDDRTAIHEALSSVHSIFSGITGVRGDILEPAHDGDTFLNGGVAISPHMAARCLFDPLRTVRFLRGIHAGIHEAMRRFPGERIQILYAGCGPYATLLLPLTTRFAPEQVQFTLIDIHKISIEAVCRIVETLGLQNYIHACVQTDAITYRHPSHIPLHLVISETMQAGLRREPQVAIMRNLLPQLAANGIFIPESIRVEACFSSSKDEDIGLWMHRDELGYPLGRERQALRLPLAQIMDLSPAAAQPEGLGQGWEAVPLGVVDVPPRDENFDQFLLMTTISIHGSHAFEPYDCELSFPLRLYELDGAAPGSRIQFSYAFGRKPGLEHRFIPREA